MVSQFPPTKKMLQNAEKPHLGSITFTNTYINILHTTANQKESGQYSHVRICLQFSPRTDNLADHSCFLFVKYTSNKRWVAGMGTRPLLF